MRRVIKPGAVTMTSERNVSEAGAAVFDDSGHG